MYHFLVHCEKVTDQKYFLATASSSLDLRRYREDYDTVLHKTLILRMLTPSRSTNTVIVWEHLNYTRQCKVHYRLSVDIKEHTIFIDGWFNKHLPNWCYWCSNTTENIQVSKQVNHRSSTLTGQTKMTAPFRPRRDLDYRNNSAQQYSNHYYMF